MAAVPAPGAGDALEVGDQVRIKVFEWRSSVGDVHEWTALNGDYRIGADGTVTLPLVGGVKAAGATTAELSEAISTRLQSGLGLTIRPQASVEIVQYRPFFILGDVAKPGEYPYMPGLTVLQAISIAGGRYRINDPTAMVSTAGELNVLRLQYGALLARRARLQAELADAPGITFPAELQRRQSDPNVAQLMAREQAIFTSRRDALRAQLDAFNQLKTLLGGEVTALQAKMKNVDRELALIKQELNNTTALVDRGLAIAPRVFSQRETEIQTEGRRLDLDTAALRAKEDIGKADQAIVELRGKTRNDLETQLADVEQRIPETAARIRASALLLGRDPGADEGAAASAPTKCVILRRDGQDVRQIQGDETTIVKPGDTIKVLPVAAEPSRAAAQPATGNSGPEHDATLLPPTPQH